MAACYPDDNDLNFDGIDFPTPLPQISKIEKQNGTAIHVFGWNNKDEEVFVYRLSGLTEYQKKIHLMLLEEIAKFQYKWDDNNVTSGHRQYPKIHRSNLTSAANG